MLFIIGFLLLKKYLVAFSSTWLLIWTKTSTYLSGWLFSCIKKHYFAHLLFTAGLIIYPSRNHCLSQNGFWVHQGLITFVQVLAAFSLQLSWLSLIEWYILRNNSTSCQVKKKKKQKQTRVRAFLCRTNGKPQSKYTISSLALLKMGENTIETIHCNHVG